MALYKRLFVNITRAVRRLYTAIYPVNNLYNEFIIQHASFFREKVRFLHESTVAI
jgi:hypothetical protein